VRDLHHPTFDHEKRQLVAALKVFRGKHGFGRGIAAPQVGIAKRFIVLNLGNGPFCAVNPEITWRSEESFTLWDDCMSFPTLLVRLHRYSSISIRYTDAQGRDKSWDKLDRASAELLQHEIDHLDGVLAIDHAIDQNALVSRSVFEANPEHLRQQVDYWNRP
jgi:peptide deformylase